MKIPIFGPDAVAWTPFPCDWFGRPPRSRAEFGFQLEGDRLRFRLRVHGSTHFDTTLTPGSFVEGLWEQDVAEFFIAGPEEDYQEFNIAPSGAWWSAHFSSYRQLIEPVRCASIEVNAEVCSTHWEVDCSLSLSEILPLRGGELTQMRINPTAIAFADPREYLCYAHGQGGTPDFHLASNFLPVQFCAAG